MQSSSSVETQEAFRTILCCEGEKSARIVRCYLGRAVPGRLCPSLYPEALQQGYRPPHHVLVDLLPHSHSFLLFLFFRAVIMLQCNITR
jgi:hypothetical protein